MRVSGGLPCLMLGIMKKYVVNQLVNIHTYLQASSKVKKILGKRKNQNKMMRMFSNQNMSSINSFHSLSKPYVLVIKS